MYQVRAGTFETNSSSTHSIAISKAKIDTENLPKTLSFHVGKFGWEEGEYSNTQDYLYTAMRELGMIDALDRLEEILAEYGVKAIFHKPKKDEWYSVDHSSELLEFIDDLIANPDKLLRFLFGDSCVYTGNDNSSEDDSMCWCAEPYMYDWEKDEDVPNPNHDEDSYEYYFKGN